MGVSLRVLKQIKQQKSELRQLQCQEQRIDRMPYSYSGLSRAHIFLQPDLIMIFLKWASGMTE